MFLKHVTVSRHSINTQLSWSKGKAIHNACTISTDG